jgi:hypothetical protein
VLASFHLSVSASSLTNLSNSSRIKRVGGDPGRYETIAQSTPKIELRKAEKIFIVHGHDLKARRALSAFLSGLGEPIVPADVYACIRLRVAEVANACQLLER